MLSQSNIPGHYRDTSAFERLVLDERKIFIAVSHHDVVFATAPF